MEPQLEFYHSKKAMIAVTVAAPAVLLLGLVCILFPQELVDTGSYGRNAAISDILFKNKKTTQYTGYGLVGFSSLLIPLVINAFRPKPYFALYDDHLLITKIKIERNDICDFVQTHLTGTPHIAVQFHNPTQ